MPHGFQSRQDFKFSNLCYGSSSGTSAITSEMSQFSVSQILIRVGMEICSTLPMLAIWFVVKCAWSRKSFLLMFLSISVFQSGLQLILTAGAAPALWPFNHYTAIIEKTQCTVAILLQKLRHTQRICLYINLGIKCFMPSQSIPADFIRFSGRRWM